MQLFGFYGEKERELFNMLITVSGIGPRLALIILSGLTPDELQQALARGQEKDLLKISGVGKKTAQRLIVELKDKMITFAVATDTQPPLETHRTAAKDIDQAVQALIALGFKPVTAKDTVNKICKKFSKELSLEEIIRHALKR